MSLDEAEPEEILHLQAVDLLRPAPLEFLERFRQRETGALDAPLDAARLAAMGLAFNETAQIIEVGPLLCNRVVGERLAY